MASVYFAIAEFKVLRPVLLSTGQHREMLDQAMGAFGLKPDVDLGLMQPGWGKQRCQWGKQRCQE